jgi:hypothetical protein
MWRSRPKCIERLQHSGFDAGDKQNIAATCLFQMAVIKAESAENRGIMMT